jgi:hypothetical protein
MSDLVRVVSTSEGGVGFEIDLSAFLEPEPLFGYVDDVGGGIKPLFGLVVAGRMIIADQPPFMWLEGSRDCVLLKTSAQGKQENRVSFLFLSVGEFCLEIYHISPDGSVELLYKNDCCFK